jgi:lipopolysaccharide export system permease protein
MALPLSILISSVMTFGNFGEHYELVAIKSSGISFLKTMRSLIVTSLVISVLAFFFSNNALPYVELKKKTVLYDIRHKKLAFNIKEGEFYQDIEGFAIRVGKKEDKKLYDILIYDHTNGVGATKMTIAERGIMKVTNDGNTVVLVLENGWNYEEGASGTTSGNPQVRPMQRVYYESQIMHFDISGFNEMNRTDESLFGTNHTMLNLNQLNQAIDSLQERLDSRRDEFIASSQSAYTALHTDLPSPNLLHPSERGEFEEDVATPSPDLPEGGEFEGDVVHGGAKRVLDDVSDHQKVKISATALRSARNMKQSLEFYVSDLSSQEKNIKKHEVIRQEKFTLSFACLVLFFIGAPLGSIIRKGGLGFPLIVATLLFIIYYVITMLGKKYAVAGELPVWTGAWLSTLVLFPFGLFLTSKANNDSPLFDFDS